MEIMSKQIIKDSAGLVEYFVNTPSIQHFRCIR